MHILILTVPFYSHLKSQKSLIGRFLDAGHAVTVMTHPVLQPLVEELGAGFHPVHWMDWFLEHPKIEQANGLAYTSAMLRETAHLLPQMIEEVERVDPDAIVFDSATRWGKLIAKKLDLPALSWSAMYPPLYQYKRTHQIRPQLLREGLRSPRSFYRIGKAITRIIFDHKPQDYDELYTWLYDDTDIGHHTSIPLCMFETPLPNLHCYPHHGLAVENDEPLSLERSWIYDEERILIYVSFGTLIRIDQTMLNVLRHVAGTTLRFIVSTGPGGSQGRCDEVVRGPFVPQKTILNHVQLCITHGGINTVVECMARKIPMLCVPFLTDQWMYSRRVVQLGLGTLLKKTHCMQPYLLQENVMRMLLDREMYQSAYKEIDLHENTIEYSNMIEYLEHIAKT